MLTKFKFGSFLSFWIAFFWSRSMRQIEIAKLPVFVMAKFWKRHNTMRLWNNIRLISPYLTQPKGGPVPYPNLSRYPLPLLIILDPFPNNWKPNLKKNTMRLHDFWRSLALLFFARQHSWFGVQSRPRFLKFIIKYLKILGHFGQLIA